MLSKPKEPSESKEVLELQAQVNFLRREVDKEDEEGRKELDALETKLAAARAKGKPPKSASAELRAAESRRAAAAKKKQLADDEVEAVEKARIDLDIRAARALASQAETQQNLDEADIGLVRC